MFQLLSIGNKHLGLIPHFSLPRGVTCPGMSEWCRQNCYCRRGRQVAFQRVKDHYWRNYEVSQSDDFVELMCEDLKKVPKFVRLHTSGDFYSAEYIRSWYEIAKKNRRITFLAYTKSWRVPELANELRELAKLKNFVVYASTDETTGPPPEDMLEAGVKKTYKKPAKACVKRKAICSSCLYCFKGKGNVAFVF
ncbi:MAG: hypothetical protein DRP11_00970 [Candidatus Aenigmatarchaeota archaeon]|nr:MAG: hypothetical protein DRP11_00970 [Candidatus Aenigmarchaeota archaeon]